MDSNFPFPYPQRGLVQGAVVGILHLSAVSVLHSRLEPDARHLVEQLARNLLIENQFVGKRESSTARVALVASDYAPSNGMVGTLYAGDDRLQEKSCTYCLPPTLWILQ